MTRTELNRKVKGLLTSEDAGLDETVMTETTKKFFVTAAQEQVAQFGTTEDAYLGDSEKLTAAAVAVL